MKTPLHFLAIAICVFILIPARAATISLFSSKTIASQTRGWNGPKDASAVVTIAIENDLLVTKAVVNDDRIAQNREDTGIDAGDHIELWICFASGRRIHLGFSPGRRETTKPATVLWEKKRAQTLESTPPIVAWSDSGYELDAAIPLADLRVEPDDPPKLWAAALADRDMEPAPEINLLRDMTQQLRYFIGRCHESELKFIAAEKPGSDELESRMAQLIRYQKEVPPRERVDGILFDLSSFGPGDPSQRLAQAAQDWHRQFRYAQFWVVVPAAATTRSNDSILKPADQVILMASGAQETDWTAALKPGLHLAQQFGKPFWIGIDVRAETIDNARLEHGLAQFSSKIGGIQQFTGLVIDDYRRYRRLGEGTAGANANGPPKQRALWIRCGDGGLGEAVMRNDYFQKDFFRFCAAPFGEKKNKITHLLFDMGRFTRGSAGAEVLLRQPGTFKDDEPKTWTPFK